MPLLEKKWCLGNVVLPLEQHTCDLVDLKNGVVGDDENCSFLFLPLKSTGQTEWLEGHLKQRCRWWKRSGRYQPLMQELIEALPGSSKKQKYAGLTSRVVVPIEVRGKTILVLNNRNAPALAFHEGDEEFESLQWFLQEMTKDLQELSTGNSKRDPAQGTRMMEEDEIIQEIVENLKQHANCKTAYFMPSSNRICVVTHMKERKVLTVKDLNKRRKEALQRQDGQLWVRVRSSFLTTCGALISFLDGEPDDDAEASDTTEEQGLEDKELDGHEEQEQGDEDQGAEEQGEEEEEQGDEAEDAHEPRPEVPP